MYAAAFFWACRGFAETIHLHAATAQSVFHFYAVAIGTDAIGSYARCSCKCGRAEQAASETRAFLVGPIDELHGDWRLAVVLRGDATQDFESRENIERSIEPATVRDGIQMPANEQRPFGSPFQRDPIISGGVVVMLDRQLTDFRGEPLARFEPRIRPRDTLRAVFIAGEGAKLFQLGDCSFRIECHGFVFLYPETCATN